MKWIRFVSNDPDILYYKYNFDDEFQAVKVSGSSRGRKSVENVGLQQKYTSKLPILAAKKRDLMPLCHSGIIPEEYHAFYNGLVSVEQEVSGSCSE